MAELGRSQSTLERNCLLIGNALNAALQAGKSFCFNSFQSNLPQPQKPKQLPVGGRQLGERWLQWSRGSVACGVREVGTT